MSSSDSVMAVIILIGMMIVALIIASIFIFRIFHLKTHRRDGGNLDMSVLKLRLPRFASSKEEETTQLSAVQEDIAVAETVFAALGGLPGQRGFKAWMHGRTDQISFEIVTQHGVIYFYIAVPDSLKSLVVQQMHGQFPNADIEDVDDYNIFTPTGVVLGSYLKFKRENLFPIKTYRQLESDPLNAILNALAKVPTNEGAAIQFVVRSARPSWRSRGLKVVERLHEGMDIKEALKGKKKADKLKLGEMVSGQKQDKAPEPTRQLSEQEREMAKNIEQKASKAGFDVNIRVIASAETVSDARASLNNITNSFAQYNVYQYGNSFSVLVPGSVDKIAYDFIYRIFSKKHQLVLNTEEMASLWHPPLPGTDTMSIDWLGARKSGAPANIATDGLFLGNNEFRGKKTPIHIKPKDRQRHMYIIGKSGSGKSVFMGNMAMQDIIAGHGVCVVDPHGDLVEELLGIIPKERVNDVIVFSPYDRDMPMGLNMLESPSPELNDLVVGDMISIFYKLFPPEMIGPMFEHVMRNVMLTLMSDPENPGTIAEIPRMITDEAFQKSWVAKVTDPVVRDYWEKEVANTADFHKSEMFGYLTSKVGRFVEDAMMRNIIGQAKSGFTFRDVMDNKKILLVDLNKGKTGDMNMQLLGLVIVSKLQMAAMARSDMAEEDRQDFYLYIDEFQNFVTPSIATILSEARKYRLNLIMGHQYVGQVVEKGDTEIKDAIFGNVGSMFVSRIGPEDTEIFSQIFEPTFNGNDLINSDPYTWYVKMIVDNNQVAPFTMHGPAPIKPNLELAKKVRQLSRVVYARKRDAVEKEIAKRAGFGIPTPPPAPPPPPAPAPAPVRAPAPPPVRTPAPPRPASTSSTAASAPPIPTADSLSIDPFAESIATPKAPEEPPVT